MVRPLIDLGLSGDSFAAAGYPGLGAIWAETRGDPAIRVAVLDGPVDISHPSLARARLTQIDTLVPAHARGGAACHHGTHVASIIFGQLGTAIEGIAPACSGLLAPIFADGAQNALIMCSQVDLARAILQAVDRGAHVINISGGQLIARDNTAEPLLEKAVRTCAERNVLVIAAAGNDGCDCLHVPAALDTVLSVGAMNASGAPLAMSNWGGAYQAGGILAPGRNIPGAVPGGGVGLKSGTSFATAIVTGIAALLLSVQRKYGKEPDPHAVRLALIASAAPCNLAHTADGRRCLAGRIDPQGALNLITQGGSDMSDTLVNPSEASIVDTSAAEGPAEAPALDPEFAKGGALKPRPPMPIAAVTASEVASPPLADAAGPAAARITPSDCGCGGGAKCTCGTTKTTQLVYALGRIGYDFGSEARRDSFQQAMGNTANPHDPNQMIAYINAHPYEAESLTWTLNLDATPIYAIVPSGPFASVAYERLRTAFEGQLRSGVELASVPGVVAGAVTLLSGQTVPAIVPNPRGMYSWAPGPLVESVLGARPQARDAQDQFDSRAKGLVDFLSRIYYDMRNLGVSGGERALNYAATNAFQASQVIDATVQNQLELDRIDVLKSPVCRPDSECYDIELAFFSPGNVNIANRVFRFTVDVSDVIPVSIGQIRTWSKRA